MVSSLRYLYFSARLTLTGTKHAVAGRLLKRRHRPTQPLQTWHSCLCTVSEECFTSAREFKLYAIQKWDLTDALTIARLEQRFRKIDPAKATVKEMANGHA